MNKANAKWSVMRKTNMAIKSERKAKRYGGEIQAAMLTAEMQMIKERLQSPPMVWKFAE